MYYIRRVIIALVLLSVSNVFAYSPSQKQKPRPKQPEVSWVDAQLASMTLDEKIGQLIIPATVGMFMTETSDTFQEIQRDIQQFHVGGYHMLGDVTMLHEPSGVATLINRLQKLAKAPLFITADFEGGVGYRFVGATRLLRTNAAQFQKLGYKVVIFPQTAFRMMLRAVANTYKELMDTGTQKGMLDRMMTREEIYNLIAYYTHESCDPRTARAAADIMREINS